MLELNKKIQRVDINLKGDKPSDLKKFDLNSGKILERPIELKGTTYKLRPGNSEHALYLTINDININGETRPYEIFINTKNAASVQWVNVVTRLVSSVMRSQASNEKYNIAFAIEDLLSTYDHSDMFFNGEFTKHPITMPSTVAYIGYAIRHHLIKLGLYELEKYDIPIDNVKQEEIANAQICPKCQQKTFVKQDCWLCIECGYSNCG